MKRAAVMACVLLTALASRDGGAQGILRSGHPGEPDSLDPHMAISAPSLIVTNDLFEGLMTLDARGQPVAGAAQSVAVSDSGRSYDFTLRPGLAWSDGRPIEAADFVWSMQRLADPRTAATLLAGYVDLIRNGAEVLAGRLAPPALAVTAPDVRTVRIELARPVPYFLNVIAFPAFAPVPRHVIEKHGREWSKPGHFVGNGPFMLKEWVPGNHVLAVRNPHFHDRRNVRLNGVLYRPVADLGAGLRLFQTGELDTLTNFPPERLEWLKAHMPRELRLAPSLGVTVYVFNHRLEQFRDPRVRRALSLAIDRDLLTTRIVRSGDRPAYGLIPAGLPGHAAPAPRPPNAADADRAEARRLLGLAGYGVRHPLEFQLLYHTSEEHRKVAVAVASMWQSVGVRARLRNAERQVVEVASRNGEFEIVRAAWFSSYADPMGLFAYLRAGNPANAGAYRLPAFDATLERADAAAAGTRAQLLRLAEQQVMADQAVIPLYFLVSRRLVATRVVGWRDDNLTALRPARWLALR